MAEWTVPPVQSMYSVSFIAVWTLKASLLVTRNPSHILVTGRTSPCHNWKSINFLLWFTARPKCYKSKKQYHSQWQTHGSSEEVKATESKRKLLDNEKRVISVSHPLPYKHTTYKGLHREGRSTFNPNFHVLPTNEYLCVGSLMPPGGGRKETLFFCPIYILLLKLKWTVSWRKRSTSPDFLAHASNWVSMKYTVSFKLPQRRGGNKTTAKLVQELCLLFSYYKIETWR